jgi:hypothetical protein
MNMGICVKTDDINDFDEQAIHCQRKVQELLLKLINRPTKLQNPKKLVNFNKWKLYDDSIIMYPNKEVIKSDSIYPLHCALQLEKRNEISEDLLAHIYELRSLASS